MTTKTKSFSSTMTGASVLSGTPGAKIAVLDAVLVNGFGSTSVVSLTVAGGIATATYSGGHPFDADTVSLWAGATPAGLNGEKRILTKGANVVTFDATGIADVTATGTITSKVAPAGWTKAFAGTNLAVYKSSSVEGTGFYLRVDDTGTTSARVRGYETMSDVNTGTGPFPTVAQIAETGLWWSKSNAASAAARPWRIYADDRSFAFCVKNADTTSEAQSVGFGDFLSLKSNDPYACFIRGGAADRSASQSISADDLGHSTNYLLAAVNGCYVARAANTLGGAQAIFHGASLAINTGVTAHTPGTVGPPYPSPVDNGLRLSPVELYDGSGARGYIPGLYYPHHTMLTAFSTDDVVLGSGAMVGKKVKAVRTGALNNGTIFFDHTSDWR